MRKSKTFKSPAEAVNPPKIGDYFTPSELKRCPEDYRGKVLVLDPAKIKAEHRANRFNMVWKACGGFGCDPAKLGRAVFAVCAADGEEARWDRHAFLAEYVGELPRLAFQRQQPAAPAVETLSRVDRSRAMLRDHDYNLINGVVWKENNCRLEFWAKGGQVLILQIWDNAPDGDPCVVCYFSDGNPTWEEWAIMLRTSPQEVIKAQAARIRDLVSESSRRRECLSATYDLLRTAEEHTALSSLNGYSDQMLAIESVLGIGGAK